MKGPNLIPVARMSDIIENVRQFKEAARQNPHRLRELARQTSLWVFDGSTETFGPNKWCGFVAMNAATYADASAHESTGAIFDGHVARVAIERVTEGEFSPSLPLHHTLRTWADHLFGSGALAGLDESKWEFLILPASTPDLVDYRPLYIESMAGPQPNTPAQGFGNVEGAGVGIPELAAMLNEKAAAYRMGNFQVLRKKLKGLSRVYTKQIFADSTTHDEWAFHSGGRQEIQFNIGLEEVDGRRMLRHGLAFSLEPSRAFPAISLLLPKIARFNDYVRESAGAFPDMNMWHFGPQGRSADYGTRVVPPELFKPNTFIFLGKQEDPGSPDIDLILCDFDRLLPLYEYVEGADSIRLVPGHAPETFGFRAGCSVKKSATTMTTAERMLDVTLHHNDLQHAVYESLAQRYGREHVGTENSAVGGRRIDVVVEVGDEHIFYEIKTSTCLQSCIREALGQLLEYSYWASPGRATRLILVTENERTREAEGYLRLLREKFGLAIYHQRYDPGSGRLGDPW